MTTMHDAIQSVLNAPPRIYTKEEAQQLLRHLGVLNDDNSVRKEFSHIFVPKEEPKDVKQ